MIKRIAFTASALAVLAAAAQAQVPFLSFADNSALSVTRTDLGNGFDTSFTGAGGPYSSITAPVVLTGVSFSFNAPALTAFGTGLGLNEDAPTDSGVITVTDTVLGKLFDVSFDSGFLTPDNFTASNLNAQGLDDNVVFFNINPILAPYITNTGNNAISFSFSNPTPGANSISYSTSASFASQPVPEPATMAALGLGAAAMLRRRRKA